MTDPADAEPRTVKTVETTIRIIDALRDLEGAGVTEIASKLDSSKGGVYNHLATLRKHGYVYKNGDEYRLSYQFLQHGEFVRNRSRLYIEGREETRKLAEETGEYAHLMTEHDGRGVHLAKSKGENALGEEFFSKKREETDYLHHGSTGKAILAHLPEERVEAIIDEHGMPSLTDQTITDRDALFEELATIHDQGYAQNDEEAIRELRAVGAPILGPAGEVLGAISVSGPTSRIRDDLFDQTYPEAVKKRANVIELNVGYADQTNQLE